MTDTTDDIFDTPIVDGLRGVRYGEVLIVRHVDGRFSAEVWNTLGLNDCPQELWDRLDAEQIAAERDALLVLLNGPRYWMVDSIRSGLRAAAPTTSFGELGTFQAAVLDLGTEPPASGAYVDRHVHRQTVFGFAAGTEVHELVDPDGVPYVLQAYSLAVDPTQTEEDLAGLGERLDLPEGWTFRVRTLEDDLGLLSRDGVATVTQDELQNTYQRADRTVAVR